MKETCRIAAFVIAALSLAGCQKPTGYEVIDSHLVQDYEKRLELTWLLHEEKYYHQFGCWDLLALPVEPSFFERERDLVSHQFKDLKIRALEANLLFEVIEERSMRERSPILSLEEPREFSNDEEVKDAMSECVEGQKAHLKKIDRLLEELGA